MRAERVQPCSGCGLLKVDLRSCGARIGDHDARGWWGVVIAAFLRPKRLAGCLSGPRKARVRRRGSDGAGSRLELCFEVEQVESENACSEAVGEIVITRAHGWLRGHVKCLGDGDRK